MPDSHFIVVTEGNLSHRTIYVDDVMAADPDFFPADVLGQPKLHEGGGVPISVDLDGEIVATDIGTNSSDGSPRHHLREREAVGRFYSRLSVLAGQQLRIERMGERQYRVTVGSPMQPTF